MIDSHCHLNFKSLKNNISELITRAKKNNITSILSINTKIEEFKEHYDLIKQYQSIYISSGVHPEHINNNNIPTTKKLTSLCTYDRVIGIGETGLDFYYSTEHKDSQYRAFEKHIECSYEKKLPLIIHQRNSENEIIDLLQNYQKEKPLNIVFHCFTGTSKLRNFCLDNNFYISLSGIVTFKNANDLRNVIKSIPLKSILIETDSPFLSPAPYRGKTNEPSYVYYIGKYLANFYNVETEEFEKITDRNFYQLFSKAIPSSEIV